MGAVRKEEAAVRAPVAVEMAERRQTSLRRLLQVAGLGASSSRVVARAVAGQAAGAGACSRL